MTVSQATAVGAAPDLVATVDVARAQGMPAGSSASSWDTTLGGGSPVPRPSLRRPKALVPSYE